MALLHLEPLSSRTTKGDLLRFLCEQAGLDRAHVGRIDVQRRTATIEVPDARIARVVRALDGASVERRAGSLGLQRMGALLAPAGLLPSLWVLSTL